MVKKASLSALFIALILGASAPAQDNLRGEFYVKDKVKGFFSLKGDYRVLSDESMDRLNRLLFENSYGFRITDSAGNELLVPDTRQRAYGRFAPEIQGLHFEIGANYKQFLTWIDVNTMLTQVSAAPRMPAARREPLLRDVKWFSYGADWMFGWMLLPEEAPIQFIPSLGLGLSLLNIKLAQDYDFYYGGAQSEALKPYTLSDEFISAVGKTAVAEFEVRLRMFLGLSAGFYGGYRVISYDDIILQKDDSSTPATTYFVGTGEVPGDSWYVGGKLTFTLSSTAEKRQKSRL